MLQVSSLESGAYPVPMSNDVKIFEHNQFGNARIIMRGDEPWFVAKDVCEALEYVWNGLPRIAHVPEEWRGVTSVVTPSGIQEMHILSEQGLYFFLGRSDKPGALPYQKWVAGGIMPSIRKHGTYGLPQTLPEALRLAADLAEKAERAALERDEAVRTKALIGSSREATSMATASAAVRKSHVLEDTLGIGRNYRQVKAIEWLRYEFDLSMTGAYSQIGKKLSELATRMGYPTRMVPDEKYPGGVKSYHVDVVDAFRALLRTDLNMLAKFRRR